MAKRVQHAQGLIHVTPQGEIVDSLALNHAFGVNQEGAAKRKRGFLVEHVVSLRHGTIFIAQQRVAESANATLMDSCIPPVDVGLCIVNGNTQNLGASLFELTKAVVKSDEFRRSDKGKIFGVKEKNYILTFVIRKRNFLCCAIGHHCSCSEIWSWLVHEYRHAFPGLKVVTIIRTKSCRFKPKLWWAIF